MRCGKDWHGTLSDKMDQNKYDRFELDKIIQTKVLGKKFFFWMLKEYLQAKYCDTFKWNHLQLKCF